MAKQKMSEILAQAYGLVQVVGAKGYFAYDAQGRQVEEDDPTACTYCSIGALGKVVRSHGGIVWHSKEYDFLAAAAKEQGEMPYYAKRAALYGNPEAPADWDIVSINDHGTKAQLHKMWTRAIELAREAEAC